MLPLSTFGECPATGHHCQADACPSHAPRRSPADTAPMIEDMSSDESSRES